MGNLHFPPPESSPRSNRPPTRFTPGNQRVQAELHNPSKFRPSKPPYASNWNNKPSSRSPKESLNGSSNFNGNHTADYRRVHRDFSAQRQSSDRSYAVGRFGKDHPLKYDARARSLTAESRNPSEVRPKLPEKFYSLGGESFAEVMKKPAPVYPRFENSRAVAELEGQLHDADDIVGKHLAHTNFQRSTENAIGYAEDKILYQHLNQNLDHFDLNPNSLATDRADKEPDESILISNLNLDQDLNGFDPPIISVMATSTDELPTTEKLTPTENVWGFGSFVDVLKKPAPVKTVPEVPSAAPQFEGQRRQNTGGRGEPSKNSARNASAVNGTTKNAKNSNSYQNQKRYDRKGRPAATRGRETAMERKSNRKEHHSRGEESVRDAANKKIRTPEFQVPIPSSYKQAEYQPQFYGEFGSYRNNADGNPVSPPGVNVPVANSSTFEDGIFHRRSFLDVVKRGAQ